jgi:hypothetical protein
MGQIKANGAGVEFFERHLLDGKGIGPRIKMHRRIHMRAGMIRHGEIKGLTGEGCIASHLFFGMIAPDGHHHRRVAWVCLRAVKDFSAEVNKFHGAVPFANAFQTLTPRMALMMASVT